VAKANIVLPGGTKVTIEGTAEEVATLLEKFSADTTTSAPRRTASKSKGSTKSGGDKKKPKARKGPTGLILALRDDGFFKARKTLPDIQKKLEEQGHIYAQTSLSPVLVRLVRSKELRRLKEKKGWVYVN
jgi:hypothetical protein